MASLESSTTAMSTASIAERPEALHTPHSYLRQDKPISSEAHLAERVFMVARGAQALAGILHSEMLAADNGTRPLFDVNTTEALIVLLSESMGMLANVAERRIDSFNTSTTQGA